LDLIPNSGIAITMDIGEEHSIHPAKKKEVADRLLFNALDQTYGYKTIDGAGPIYESQEQKDGGLVLKFKNTKYGLYAFNGLTGFEIAGEDRVFYSADAKIVDSEKVFVKNDKVVNPVAVRYAWRNWIIGTLFNTDILPLSSFRTDSWDNATQGKN
jgi:sialate O-acetylesterase